MRCRREEGKADAGTRPTGAGLEALRRGEASALVATTLDRVTRSIRDAAADLRAGCRMEIKSWDGVCEWIKVEVTEPPK